MAGADLYRVERRADGVNAGWWGIFNVAADRWEGAIFADEADARRAIGQAPAYLPPAGS